MNSEADETCQREERTSVEFTCRDCRYFNNDSRWLEEAFPGLRALSSAYGTSRGENGICVKRDLYLAPIKQCRDFEARSK